MTCDKVCRICGNRFTGTNGNSCYCSDYCRTIGKEQKKRESEEKRRQRKPWRVKSIFRTKQCAKCGDDFKGTRNAKYCDACLLSGDYKMRQYYQNRKYTEEDAK